jgi:hypothetical protein
MALASIGGEAGLSVFFELGLGNIFVAESADGEFDIVIAPMERGWCKLRLNDVGSSEVELAQLKEAERFQDGTANRKNALGEGVLIGAGDAEILSLQSGNEIACGLKKSAISAI